MKKTSTIIIGGGITGLTVAALLEKKGEDYLLLEALPELGGLVRSQTQDGILLDYGLKTVPLEGPLNDNPLIKLKALLGLDIAIDSFLYCVYFEPSLDYI